MEKKEPKEEKEKKEYKTKDEDLAKLLKFYKDHLDKNIIIKNK